MSRPLSRRGVGVQNCQWGSWASALGACYDEFSILLAGILCSNLLLDAMLWPSALALGACYDESSTVQARDCSLEGRVAWADGPSGRGVTWVRQGGRGEGCLVLDVVDHGLGSRAQWGTENGGWGKVGRRLKSFLEKGRGGYGWQRVRMAVLSLYYGKSSNYL